MWLTIARWELALEEQAATNGRDGTDPVRPSPSHAIAPAGGGTEPPASGETPDDREGAENRDAAVSAACSLIRAGHPGTAADLLAKAVRDAVVAGSDDATVLNLLGVIAERQGRWGEAKDFYHRAARLDGPGAAAARHNQRRYYELFTFGRSRDQAALGDGQDLPLSVPDRSLQRRVARMLREWWSARHNEH
jgi:hypothetical protein